MANPFNDYAGLNGVDVMINYIALYILQNDNLCKLLYYDSPDALKQVVSLDDMDMIRDTLIKGTIVNPKDKKIYLQPFINQTTEDKRSEIRIYPSFNIENRVLIRCIFYIDIVINNDLWELSESLIRPLQILKELLNSLNGSDVQGIGLLTCENESFNLVPFSSYFGGYRTRFTTRTS